MGNLPESMRLLATVPRIQGGQGGAKLQICTPKPGAKIKAKSGLYVVYRDDRRLPGMRTPAEIGMQVMQEVHDALGRDMPADPVPAIRRGQPIRYQGAVMRPGSDPVKSMDGRWMILLPVCGLVPCSEIEILVLHHVVVPYVRTEAGPVCLECAGTVPCDHVVARGTETTAPVVCAECGKWLSVEMEPKR